MSIQRAVKLYLSSDDDLVCDRGSFISAHLAAWPITLGGRSELFYAACYLFSSRGYDAKLFPRLLNFSLADHQFFSLQHLGGKVRPAIDRTFVQYFKR